MDVFLFLLGVYGSTWALCLTLRSAAAAGSVQAVYTFFFGTVWAPTAIALLLALTFGGRRSGTDLLRRLFRAPRSAGWFAAAAVVPFVTISLAVLAARAQGHIAPRPELSSWPLIIGLQVATGATGEELGWRGFLVPRLTQRVGFTTASVLGGLLWSGWHIAGTVFPGAAVQATPLIPFLTFVALFGIFLAFLFARTGHLLAPIVAHLSLNLTLALAGVPLDSRLFWLVVVLATATVVGVVALRAWPADLALEPAATARS
jgi:membrane protease YdiL (CAAX protease family)